MTQLPPDLAEQLSARDLLEPATRIARSHGLDVATMLGTSRERHVVASRRDFYRALTDMGWSALAIGKFLGRDHTTVLNALKGKRCRGKRVAA